MSAWVGRGVRPRDAGRLVPVDSLALLSLLCILIAVLAAKSPYFLTWANLSNVLMSMSVIGVMAAVSTLVVIGRGLDLSIGSMTAFLSVAGIVMIERWGWPWQAAFAATVVAGALCGAVNGAIIAVFRINPIITTIGTLSVFRGMAFMLTEGQSVLVNSEAILSLGSGRILGIQFSVLLMAAVFVAAHVFAEHTTAGRKVFTAGANPRAAWVAGIDVLSIRFWLMVASGVSAAVAGLLLAGQAGTATPSAGTGYELLVLTAVLLGGTSLAGGQGSVLKTALGVTIIGVLNNGMVLLSVPAFYQISANGVLLLAAVIIEQLRRGRSGPVD